MARVRSVGWRSARWYGEPTAAAGTAVLTPAIPGPSGSAVAGFTAEDKPLAAGALDERYLVAKWPWQGVRWSISYVAFLLYAFVVTTYTLPIGTATMVAVLLGIVMGERLRITAAGWMYIGFFLIATIAFALSDWKAFTTEGFTALGKMMIVFLAAQMVLDSKERLRFFIFFYLAAFAFYPIRGALFNYFIYHETVQGRAIWNQQFADPNDLSDLLLVPFSLALGLIAVERNKQLRFLAMGALVFIPFVLALAQSRGAMLAFIGGAGLIFLRNKRARKMMLVGAAVIGIVFATLAPDALWERMSSLKQIEAKGDAALQADAGSMEQRLEIWKVAVVVIAQHPVLGVGPGSYPFAHVFAARDPNVLKTAGGLRDAHSTYLTLLAEYGPFGFAFWVGAAVLVLIKAKRARTLIERQLPRHAQQLLLAEVGIITLAMAAVFGTWVVAPFTYFELAILWALAESAENNARELGIGRRAPSRTA
ncbi:MAG: O-antigen ligase family protein [Gemmatimonadaceae bacterium]